MLLTITDNLPGTKSPSVLLPSCARYAVRTLQPDSVQCTRYNEIALFRSVALFEVLFFLVPAAAVEGEQIISAYNEVGVLF